MEASQEGKLFLFIVETLFKILLKILLKYCLKYARIRYFPEPYFPL